MQYRLWPLSLCAVIQCMKCQTWSLNLCVIFIAVTTANNHSRFSVSWIALSSVVVASIWWWFLWHNTVHKCNHPSKIQKNWAVVLCLISNQITMIIHVIFFNTKGKMYKWCVCKKQTYCTPCPTYILVYITRECVRTSHIIQTIHTNGSPEWLEGDVIRSRWDIRWESESNNKMLRSLVNFTDWVFF